MVLEARVEYNLNVHAFSYVMEQQNGFRKLSKW